MLMWVQEIRLRAERRMGELLKESAETGQRQGRSQPKKVMSSSGDIKPVKLKDLGLTRDQSSDFQKLAAIPEKEFEQRPMQSKSMTTIYNAPVSRDPPLPPPHRTERRSPHHAQGRRHGRQTRAHGRTLPGLPSESSWAG